MKEAICLDLPLRREGLARPEFGDLPLSEFRIVCNIESCIKRTNAVLGANNASSVFGKIIRTSGLASIRILLLCYSGGGIDGVDVFRRLAVAAW